MFGLGGEIDFPALHQRIRIRRRGSGLATRYVTGCTKHIGAYLAVLGHTDVISFTPPGSVRTTGFAATR